MWIAEIVKQDDAFVAYLAEEVDRSVRFFLAAVDVSAQQALDGLYQQWSRYVEGIRRTLAGEDVPHLVAVRGSVIVVEPNGRKYTAFVSPAVDLEAWGALFEEAVDEMYAAFAAKYADEAQTGTKWPMLNTMSLRSNSTLPPACVEACCEPST